jgi:hypothetical protein
MNADARREALVCLRRDLYSVRHWLERLGADAGPTEEWLSSAARRARTSLEEVEVELVAIERRGPSSFQGS